MSHSAWSVRFALRAASLLFTTLLLTTLSLGALLLAGCGADEPATPAAGPLRGAYYGQEIWISFGRQRAGEAAVRTGREQEEARVLALELRGRVLAGEDIGLLARRYSNAPGGAADGFSGRLPRSASDPDDRDRALAAAEIGEVTPVVAWHDGYWFARRVDRERALVLERLFQRVRRERLRMRSIAILYRGATIFDPTAAEQVRKSKDEAVALAGSLIERLQRGAEFDALAARHSTDAYGAAHGGQVVIPNGKDAFTAWIPHATKHVPASVLEAAWSTPVGQVHPQPIISPRGVFVIRVDEVREFDGIPP